jgi:thiol:disulfide interchange protein
MPAAAETAETAPPAAKKPGKIAWETSETTARKRANAREMPLLVFLCAAWATPSVQMDRVTWADPRVVERARSFVMLRLDLTNADANAQADADIFDLQVMPSTVIVDPNGTVVVTLAGLAGPDEVLSAMNRLDVTID